MKKIGWFFKKHKWIQGKSKKGGNFGKICSRGKKTKDIWALKVIDKARVITKKSVQSVIN